MRHNLEKLSLKELEALRARVDKAIAKTKKRSRKDAMAKLRAVASQTGFRLEELMGGARRGPKPGNGTDRRRRVAPKYAHPSNKATTWSGRGRAPLWVLDYEKGGKSRDALLIKKG